MADTGKDWEFHLRTLASASRDAADPSADPSLLDSINTLYTLCKNSSKPDEELVARVYPHFNKIFHRSTSTSQTQSSSNALLLLSTLQFFLDFGDSVLHDAEPSLRTFFRSCLSREFADPAAAAATLQFLTSNNRKLVSAFPTLLPHFFPLLLKLIAWNGENVEKSFAAIFPCLISSGSFMPLFTSVVDLPIIVVALEKVERSSSGPLVGSSIASMQKSAAPEMLLALMDEAYTGSTIGDGGADSESEDSNPMAVVDPLFLDLLKDENDGLAERHWTSPSMALALQSLINNSTPLSKRLREALKISPRLLDAYFAAAFRDTNESLICALIPLIMTRYSTLFPDKGFSYEVQKRLLEFILAAFRRSPNFIALLKKPIVDRIGEVYDNPAKTELALQLCWAVGEYGGGGGSHKEAARELFESLELLLYENLSLSRLGSGEGAARFRKSCQSRMLCFVVTAIAKLATCHRELLPRARVSLGKVARSRVSDTRVWKRAQDYLGLMGEPAICLSVLGPCGASGEDMWHPGSVDWDEGRKKMIAHVPFYILGGQEGAPYHDFSFMDILPSE